jgi:hypothetical protein
VNTVRVVKARHTDSHRLYVEFSDGKSQSVDFGNFLKNSQHPEIRKFLDPKKFKQFSVRDGDLMWGDFDLIFPIMDLYDNNLVGETNQPVIKPRISSGAR